MYKPIVGITMGDPSGIGPEVSVKASISKETLQISNPVIIGDSKVVSYALSSSKIFGIKVFPIKKISDAIFEKNIINVFDLENVDLKKLEMGKISKESGRASVEYVYKAIELAQKKEIASIATGPISKEAMHKAGFKYRGHTEILAQKTKAKKYGMMFFSDKFWLILATTHIPLKDVPKKITQKRVYDSIVLGNKALISSGKKKTRIVVSGLNPHAGEGGIFGDEEKKHIIPAIKKARGEGINVSGPISPDAVFNLAASGLYDLVVAMYHDQGLIPLKLLSFNKSVNVTVGLPIIRTSVDHGTGFDIAGKGIANPQSLIQAVKVAVMLSRSK